jgi:hypothetical protein
MVQFESSTAELLVYTCLVVAGIVLLIVGYKVGSWLASARFQRQLDQNQKDLFTAQTGFKKLYEGEIVQLKEQLATVKAENETMTKRVEDYRRKAAGFGGLFGAGGKKSDAMYALLLENEALEEALHKQNTKLNVERSDAVQESLRNISYRRVLMSQLLNDDRIKDHVREILEDEGRLPNANAEQPKLPPANA